MQVFAHAHLNEENAHVQCSTCFWWAVSKASLLSAALREQSASASRLCCKVCCYDQSEESPLNYEYFDSTGYRCDRTSELF